MRSSAVQRSADAPAPASRGLVRAALLVTPLLVGAYLVLPGGHAWRGWAMVTGNLAAVAGLAAATRRARPQDRRGWRLLLVAAILWALAEVPSLMPGAASASASSAATTWPLITAACALTAAGIVALLRAHPGASPGTDWLESAVGGISFAVQWWLMSGHDTFASSHLTARTAIASLYSLADLIILIPAMALLSARSGRDSAVRLLALAATADLAGDLAFGYYSGHGGELPRLGFGAMWLAQAVLLGCAGLQAARVHPHPGRHRISVVSVAALLVATVGPLVTLAVRATWGTAPTPGETIPAVAAMVVMLGLSSIRLRGLVLQVQQQADALETASRTDDLTGVPNRRAGVRHLARALDERRPGQALTVAILDLDHFKAYNDTHGHLAGDRLLQHVGSAWARLVADVGLLYRHGGEEFVVILVGLGVQEAEDLLDRMRTVVPDGQHFSAGATQARLTDDIDSIFARADGCLYAAKAAGRDVTVSAP